ncbi:MAG: hypothetical protein OEW68_01265 [Gammaproteobacteria bacterium]|nr:hypothetical protein [Gammaproteobacteria bacterium]MDH4313453.1 hypothetical protein [Gammaproteobacteria bacterium]MDH5213029.1 hypothetical protein [Gammaproteobacteria bacterium]
MSSTQIFVLSIIAIVLCANIIQGRCKRRRKKSEVDPELEESLEKIDQLEERIRVLERIITENRYDLKREIDSL